MDTIQISTDKSKLQIDVIHNFLTRTYWAKGRTKDEVEKSIAHSCCFGAYQGNTQVGFARVCTDYTVFAYLMDVFVLPEHRGKGISKELMKAIVSNKKLESCTVWMLKTADAHGLYEQFDFSELGHPEKLMERLIK